MIERKKKIKIIQITLLFVGMLIIFFTYIKRENISDEKIISSEAQKKIKRQMENQSEQDIFYNIEYSGLDLSGNRYILKASEATTDKTSQDTINMKIRWAVQQSGQRHRQHHEVSPPWGCLHRRCHGADRAEGTSHRHTGELGERPDR